MANTSNISESAASGSWDVMRGIFAKRARLFIGTISIMPNG